MGEPTVVITIAPAGAITTRPTVERHLGWPADQAGLVVAAALIAAVFTPSPLAALRSKLHSAALIERR